MILSLFMVVLSFCCYYQYATTVLVYQVLFFNFANVIYHIIKGTASQAVRDEGKISHGFIFGRGEHMPVRMSGSIKN